MKATVWISKSETLQEVVYRWFKDEETMHYHAGDSIQAEHYIRCKLEYGRVRVSVGSNDGEVDLFMISDPMQLDNVITFLAHGPRYFKRNG